jgi:hypothetical protein
MRNLIWTGAVAIIVTASGAVAGQNPSRPAPAGIVTVLQERARIRLGLNPTALLDRILSFDANGDDRISRDELPERMEGLVRRGDRNQDGYLTSDEIVPLIDIQPSVSRRPFSVNVRGSGSLADIIADLKLPAATHNRALAIVNGPRNVYDAANVDFKAEMKDLLNDEDYENYVAAAARLRSTPRIISGNVGGLVSDPATPPR